MFQRIVLHKQYLFNFIQKKTTLKVVCNISKIYLWQAKWAQQPTLRFWHSFIYNHWTKSKYSLFFFGTFMLTKLTKNIFSFCHNNVRPVSQSSGNIMMSSFYVAYNHLPVKSCMGNNLFNERLLQCHAECISALLKVDKSHKHQIYSPPATISNDTSLFVTLIYKWA